ncbi:MAG TPA: SCO family protein [Burkholderiales bacterium]|nr:SCO family protein [Burkholderiales bacterium]
MRRLAFFMMLLAFLSGCGEKKQDLYKTFPHDLSGANYGKDFHLTDFNGKRRQLSDFRGKVVVLFFGYTHCPDVCPTTLSELAIAMKKLGKQAQKVQVLFVTVDPDRDTPKILKEYVPSFNPTFLGLYGNAGETKRTADEFHVFYQKVQIEDDMKNYAMDHTAGCFVFDTQGHLRTYMKYGEKPDEMAKDITRLLNS